MTCEAASAIKLYDDVHRDVCPQHLSGAVVLQLPVEGAKLLLHENVDSASIPVTFISRRVLVEYLVSAGTVRARGPVRRILLPGILDIVRRPPCRLANTSVLNAP